MPVSIQPSVSSVSVLRFHSGSLEEVPDLLAAEEPMEIRLGYGLQNDRSQKSLSVTMRTPGNDFELATGFLFTEGIIRSREDIASIRHCTDGGRDNSSSNIVRIELVDSVVPDTERLQRHFYTSSSCGVCGKTSIEAVRTTCSAQAGNHEGKISVSVLMQLPEQLKNAQLVFSHTGGLHASALFDTSGQLIYLREDVGRHNALDKVIGAGLAAGQLPFSGKVLLLSGRASFELIQKAAMAGIGTVVAVGAPSSLAVDLAKEYDMTLIGFLREMRFNCYAGAHRIQL